MKLSSISVLAFSAVAAAQPHGRNHPHPVKRQDVAIDYVTDIVTTTQPAAVVFVDPDGTPLSTSFINQAGQTPAPTPPADSSEQPTSNGPPADQPPPPPPPANGPDSTPPPTPYQPPQSQPPNPPSSLPSNQPPAGPGAGMLGYGLSYTPYASDGSCKTQDQVHADFEAFSGYGFVRSYGVDCDQVNTMLTAAKAKNMKLVAGIYNIPDVQTETQSLIDAAKNSWDAIDTVVIGNEAVTNGMASVDQVVSAVNSARSALRAAGYNGNVVTVDTFAQIINNPQLCQVSDFAAANCHAFFNSDLTADQAGSYVKQQAALVSQACGGKKTLITESGWPSKGNPNGAAIPSPENQKTAIDSLRSAFSSDIVLFSAFNDYWKTNNPSTFNAEQFWGIYGDAPA